MNPALAIAAVWGVVVAGLGAWLTELSPWYYALRKPVWQPPDWLFGPAWTLILGLGSLALYRAWADSDDEAGRLRVLGVFVLNGVLNIAWSPLFFRFRRPDLALIEVPFLFLSIVAMIILVAPIDRLAALLLLPYLAWVGFASVLNLTIVRLNAPFTGR